MEKRDKKDINYSCDWNYLDEKDSCDNNNINKDPQELYNEANPIEYKLYPNIEQHNNYHMSKLNSTDSHMVSSDNRDMNECLMKPKAMIYNEEEECQQFHRCHNNHCQTQLQSNYRMQNPLQQHQQYALEYYSPSNRWCSKGPTYLHNEYPYSTRNYSQHFVGTTRVSSEHKSLDMFHLTSSGREARNRAEKNRRDRLNSSIQELSTLIPHVADSPRRVDKIAVLRFATHGLRLKHVFGKSFRNTNSHTMDALMKLLDSFFLTLTCNGQIVLISASVEQYLGHCQADLYGQNILNITHPEDHAMLKQKLIPTDLESLFQMQHQRRNDVPNCSRSQIEEEIDRKLRSDKRTFTVRLAKAGPRSERPVYELVRIDGTFRRSDLAPRSLVAHTIPSQLQVMSRCHNRDDILSLHTISGNNIELVGIARIVKPPSIQRSLDSNLLEYKTRHLIDGRIVDCDQRISLVAGYMQEEVCNLSPFTFMHQDDVRWVIVALRQMYDCHSSYGESTYRLFTRNGGMIYLHTRGYLEIEKSTNKVHTFICINTQLSEEEGKRRIKEMKKNFSIIINAKIPQSSIDIPASENPQQLERAVLCLIQNLQNNPSDVDNNQIPTSSSTLISRRRSTCTPPRNGIRNAPLSLVVPNVDTVKTAIVKSVGILKITGAKLKHSINKSTNNLTENDTNSNYPSCSNNIDSHDNKTEQYEGNNNNKIQRRNSTNACMTAVKRKLNFTCDGNQDSLPIQRKVTSIENVLTTSLKELDTKLNEQLYAAMQIRDQQKKYDIPNAEDHIDYIMNEHRKQREIYNNIAIELQGQNTHDH